MIDTMNTLQEAVFLLPAVDSILGQIYVNIPGNIKV